MADVRSLLKQAQASRRITHPLLSYTKSGLLQCTACNLIIKSDSLWEGHLRSANHKKNALAAQAAPETVSKKRKLSDNAEEDERKKTKADVLDGFVDGGVLKNSTVDELKQQQHHETDQIEAGVPILEGEIVSGPLSQQPNPSDAREPIAPEPDPPKAHQPAVDEDEWAAFEREVAPLSSAQAPTDYEGATISAAPISAAELSEQQQREQQRKRRETEAEDEREEEEQRTMDEFEVMEGLEERVKRLKEKREALRRPAADALPAEEEEPPDDGRAEAEDAEEDESSEDEDDEWSSFR